MTGAGNLPLASSGGHPESAVVYAVPHSDVKPGSARCTHLTRLARAIPRTHGGTRVGRACEHARHLMVPAFAGPRMRPVGRARRLLHAGRWVALVVSLAGRGPGGSRSGSWRRHGCSGPRPWSWRSPSLRPVPGRLCPGAPALAAGGLPLAVPGRAPRGLRSPSFASTLRRRSWRPTGASPSGRRSSTSVISGGRRRPSRRRRRPPGWCRTARWRGPASHFLLGRGARAGPPPPGAGAGGPGRP